MSRAMLKMTMADIAEYVNLSHNTVKHYFSMRGIKISDGPAVLDFIIEQKLKQADKTIIVETKREVKHTFINGEEVVVPD